MAKRRRQQPAAIREPAEDQRLATLAVELGLAGAQVLREEFGFDEARANEWLQKVIARAQSNRKQLVFDYGDVALVQRLLETKGKDNGNG